ncbi:MAG: 23S rRNA (guanosine(2251)-2'-O)-methyltransferase RlmB [Bacteroidales bacterium]|jgi:23S rRNA (guanosine2251-2'-O)-methyltransferase
MKDNNSIIYGIHPLIEAIEANKEIQKILIKKDLRKSENISTLMHSIKEKNINVQYVPIEKLNKITRKNHQGVIGFVSPISFTKIEMVIPTLFENGVNPFILVLDRITDVRNFGAICRTAECAGVNAIIYPEKESALLNADAIKTSAGAIEHIPICKVNNLYETINYLKNCGLQIIGCTEKASKNYTEVCFKNPTAIIMGSEGKGIDPNLLKLSNENAFIPLNGKIESLNVSCATAIILYEVVRQRNLLI